MQNAKRFIKHMTDRFVRVMKDERGFLQSLIPLIPAVVSAFTSKKGSSGSSGGNSVTSTPNMPDWQLGLGENLSSWAQKFLSMYNPGQPYGGQLTVTDPTALEKMGLSELGGLLNQPATGDLFGAAKTQVMDTLSGKYADPATSPFIQSYTKLAGQNLRDSIDTSRRSAGARGSYFSRSAMNQESQLNERTQNYLNALIGDFLNSERGRQLTAATTAKDLEGFASDQTIKRVTASQTLGSLERVLEQADLENRYDAWLNQRTELSGVANVAGSVFGRSIPQATEAYNRSSGATGKDIAPWVSLAQQVIGMLNR
jgi:hypothetical protein